MSDKKAKYQEVAYYPGCALEGSGSAYNTSTKALGKTLGLKIKEVENWNCCGAMEVKNIDPKLQTYLSSRVMSITANEMNMDTVMVPCNGCYHNLKKAEYDLANDDETVEVVDRLSKKAGHDTYQAGQVETIHALDWVKETIGEEGLKERVKNSLDGIKIANYYGCMYTRPRHIFPEKDAGPGSESTFKPHFMDDLLEAAGAENVEFPLKTACCGGAHTLSDCDTSTLLVSRRCGSHRHRVPDLSQRTGNAPDSRRENTGHQDQCEDHLFHPVTGHGPGPQTEGGRIAREHFEFLRLCEAQGSGLRLQV